MRTIIIDDNKLAVKDLNERLARFSEVEVVAAEHSGLDGLARVSELQPDLLFLDRLDFFTHGRCRVVMYTAYDEFVLPAFRKKAFDVLLKPIDDKELDIIMQRLAEHPLLPTPQSDGQDKDKLMSDNGKFLLYTNTIDFKLVDKRDIALFQYNHEVRCWEAVVAGSKAPVRLKRTIKGDDLLEVDKQFIQVNQKFIINMNYLIEVGDNVCLYIGKTLTVYPFFQW